MATEDRIRTYYRELLAASDGVLKNSAMQPGLLGTAHQSIGDLQQWVDVLSPRPEAIVLQHALTELKIGLFSAVCGLYRPAFASLRLFLELSLGSIHFSVNRLELAEWLSGSCDIVWSAILEPEKGVLSPRFAKAFFPELSGSIRTYAGMAVTLYRELSEYVHGNHHTWGLTKDGIVFDKDLHQDWFTEFDTAFRIVTFSMCLRFLREIHPSQLSKLEDAVLHRLGHIEGIRLIFGGGRESS